MDPLEMNDEQFALYQARQGAATTVREEGDHALADRIEHGFGDDHWRVRWGLLWHMPPANREPDYIAAWNDAATADARMCRSI